MFVPLYVYLFFDTFVELANSLPGTCAPTFADDCLALVTGKDNFTLERRVNRLLDLADRWTSSAGLEIALGKTDLVYFGRHDSESPVIIFRDRYMPLSDSLKFLGVHFDKYLNFQYHVEQKVSSAKGNLMQIAAIKGAKWGPKPQLMKWAYQLSP